MEKFKSLLPFFKLPIKLLITAFLLILIIKKVNVSEIMYLTNTINWYWIILTLVLFNASKIMSAVRMRYLLAAVPISMDYLQNLKLYYTSMFYSLFVSGGIAGDGYKVIFLVKRTRKSAGRILHAIFFDRLFGMIAILFLSILFLLINKEFQFMISDGLMILMIMALTLSYPIGLYVIKVFFRRYDRVFTSAWMLSLISQLIQVACVICILFSLGIKDHLMDYVILFLISSIVTLIPLTVGGIGMREVTFVYAASFVPINPQIGILLGVLFYLINAVSSASGAFLNSKNEFSLPS